MVHIASHLNWCEHINHIVWCLLQPASCCCTLMYEINTTIIATIIIIIKSNSLTNVSMMRRVKHLLITSALYSLYSTLVMPYLNYCCGIWGYTYKSRIRPLHIIQKRATRICQKADYRSHSRPLIYQLKTLNEGVHDMVNVKSLVFMYNVYNKFLPSNIISYFKQINACHNHNFHMKNCILK